jgi:hypothetical protein
MTAVRVGIRSNAVMKYLLSLTKWKWLLLERAEFNTRNTPSTSALYSRYRIPGLYNSICTRWYRRRLVYAS